MVLFLITGSLVSMLEKEPDFEAPLLENLGKYKLEITTSNSYAERFFNQGVIMANGFNHPEAARSFREAIRQDEHCAMAYWGLAYVLGPNYNTASMMTDDRSEIINAVKKASSLKAEVQPWERALIEAIETRFPENAEATNPEGYSKSLREAFKRFPKHDFIATLYAESIMNMHAWDLYEKRGGEPQPWTPELVSVLEHALKLNSENPLANHLYIHAIEASGRADKALKSAKRLEYLVPGSGHLVHMPSHIYINTGDYARGSAVNELAVKVDSAYIAQCQVQGVYPMLYYPHNYHFLAATAALEGRGARSIEAAFKTADIIDRQYLNQPGFETTQHYITIPYNVLVKFSQWEKVLSLPQPSEDLPYPTAVWRYARGMAYANTNKLGQAKAELVELSILRDNEELRPQLIWEINTMGDVMDIAYYVLQGEIARVSGNLPKAARMFELAMEVEDRLIYNEPPDWFFAVRHFLGDVYLNMGEYAKAEKAYREDLDAFPKNGFALNGLYHALIGQSKNTEANKVMGQFEKAWERADLELEYSRIDQSKRRNLALNIKSDTPEDLIYIAGTFCSIN